MKKTAPLRAIVAIPAKNEEQHLASCLRALSAQQGSRGAPYAPNTFGILLFVNNSTDGSAKLARDLAPTLGVPMRVLERILPPELAHAGGARRGAMDAAAAWLAQGAADGLLLTTDADSRVSPTWIADNLAEVDAGADAVAGVISLEPEDELSLPKALRERGALEAIYERQLAEMAALLDPRPHNPWPHHSTMSGASLAVTLTAYRRIGGLPALPVGEDKGLVAALEAEDARVRFALGISVVTSGRRIGRAAGGVADTLRLRCEDPRAVCDEALEPARVAMLRAEWRGRLRHLHSEGLLSKSDCWAPSLGLDLDEAIGTEDTTRFGRIWNRIQGSSPILMRQRLTPCDLPREIIQADSILRFLRQGLPPGDDVQPEFREAIASDDLGEAADAAEEDLGRQIA